MPIYEYHCIHCDEDFERLELSIKEVPVSQCPNCLGVGVKVISKPGIVYEVFDERRISRLPTYQQKEHEARQHDKWLASRLKRPLPHDRGEGTKTYESDGLREPK